MIFLKKLNDKDLSPTQNVENNTSNRNSFNIFLKDNIKDFISLIHNSKSFSNKFNNKSITQFVCT